MKTVIIINDNLNPGLAANAAAVLGISMGHTHPAIIGPDLQDKDGLSHPGITQQNIPVLAASGETLKSIFRQSLSHPELRVTGFNTIAHQSRDYESYAETLSRARTCDLEFSGLSLSGTPKAVNAFTGNLKLYR